ncbi:unnamed protein product [Dovyalis caffra]|uniref:Uncharacterized protein n=1 Tax=Dovyalis caffra TaxID=77055 RepID=A0AAV1S8I3_9ROSI|nr:unnamed protein product [Dovyalis caffra]
MNRGFGGRLIRGGCGRAMKSPSKKYRNRKPVLQELPHSQLSKRINAILTINKTTLAGPIKIWIRKNNRNCSADSTFGGHALMRCATGPSQILRLATPALNAPRSHYSSPACSPDTGKSGARRRTR